MQHKSNSVHTTKIKSLENQINSLKQQQHEKQQWNERRQNQIQSLQTQIVQNKGETENDIADKTKKIKSLQQQYEHNMNASKQELSASNAANKQLQQENSSLQSQMIQIQQDIANNNQSMQALQATIMTLRNENNALKQQQNDEEKKKEEDPNINLKQDLSSMTENMTKFNIKYNKESISKVYDNNPDALDVDTELDEADISCRSTLKQLQDIKGYIDELTKIDLSVYESWDIETTMKWIKSLDEGRFVKYLDHPLFFSHLILM